jgi:hypothetical protein
MALGCGLTFVRGNRGENYKKMNYRFAKNISRKKKRLFGCPLLFLSVRGVLDCMAFADTSVDVRTFRLFDLF